MKFKLARLVATRSVITGLMLFPKCPRWSETLIASTFGQLGSRCRKVDFKILTRSITSIIISYESHFLWTTCFFDVFLDFTNRNTNFLTTWSVKPFLSSSGKKNHSVEQMTPNYIRQTIKNSKFHVTLCFMSYWSSFRRDTFLFIKQFLINTKYRKS